MLGAMRLRWWMDGLAEVAHGQPARAPVLAALRGARETGRLDQGLIARIAEARHDDAERAVFADEPQLTRYLDDTAGALMLAAARLLAPETPDHAVAGAARAWGWASWLRARPALNAAGGAWSPLSWGDSSAEEARRHIVHRVTEALADARAELKALPGAAFPAVAYAALALAYAKGAAPGPLGKRLRLTWAVIRGRA